MTKKRKKMEAQLLQMNNEMHSDIIFNIYDIKNRTSNAGNLYYAFAIMNNMTMVNNGKSSFLGGLDLYYKADYDIAPGDLKPSENTENSGKAEDAEDDSSFFPKVNKSNCTFDQSTDCTTEIFSIPVVKFSFYENGTLNEIYKPIVIDLSMWSTLLDAIKQFTPALSKRLYDSQLRHLDDTESLHRTFQKEGTNTKLQETSINKGGIDGIEIDSSNIRMEVNTIVDELQGKITSVSSSGESKFVTSNNTLDDIPINEDSSFI